jgi:hypothetical protein
VEGVVRGKDREEVLQGDLLAESRAALNSLSSYSAEMIPAMLPPASAQVSVTDSEASTCKTSMPSGSGEDHHHYSEWDWIRSRNVSLRDTTGTGHDKIRGPVDPARRIRKLSVDPSRRVTRKSESLEPGETEMSTYGGNGSLLGRLITYMLIALVGIVVLKMAFWVFGAALGLGAFILFTVGPILLIGWVVVKVYGMLTGPRGYE